MEYHSQNVGAITLVEIPIVSDTDFKFFDLYLFIYVFKVRYDIWRELNFFNDFIQKMLKRGDYVTMVVLSLRILLDDFSLQ